MYFYCANITKQSISGKHLKGKREDTGKAIGTNEAIIANKAAKNRERFAGVVVFC